MLKTDNPPLVSIVIVNYNGKRYLANCINSVLQTSYPNFEVILVDNASTDQSITDIKETFGSDSRIKIVESPINTGFSGGNNIGFSYSNGEYIAFLNNDTTVESDWLTHLVNALQNDLSIGLAQSMILTIDGEKIQTVGWLYSDYLVLMHGLAKGKSSSLQFKSVFEVPVASGTCMMIRRDLLDAFGLFNPDIPFFYDDTLLSFKVWLANKKVVTVPASKIRHIGGATDLWNIQFTSYNFLKAKLCLIFDVYCKPADIAKALFVNFFSLTVNSVLNLKFRNTAAVFANLRASVWGLRNTRFLWKNRVNHWSKTKVSPNYLSKKFAVVNMPVPLYLLPSKLSSDIFNFEADKYENRIILK